MSLAKGATRQAGSLPPKTKEAKSTGNLHALEARLDELKKSRNEEVTMLAVPLDDTFTEHTACYLEELSIQTISAAMSMTASGQILESSLLIMRTHWIEGDKRILEDKELLLSAHFTIQGMIKYRQGVLKKK